MIRRLFMPRWKREFWARVEALGPKFTADVSRYAQGVRL